MASALSPGHNFSYENLLLANGSGGFGGGSIGMTAVFAIACCCMSVCAIVAFGFWYNEYDGKSKIDELLDSLNN